MKERLAKFKVIFHTPLLIYFFLFMGISLTAIASAAPIAAVQFGPQNFLIRQLIFFALGGVVMLVTLFFGLKRLRFMRFAFYGTFIVLLALIWFFNTPPDFGPAFIINRGGSTRWIDVGFFYLQPSEFMRLGIILVLADIIQRHNEKYPHDFRTFKTDFFLILKGLAVVLIPSFLIFRQPDAGITILILITMSFMFLASGIKWTYIVVVATVGIVGIPTFMALMQHYPEFFLEHGLMEQYQINRFYGWFDPFASISGVGRQLGLGLQAMGSGGIFGNGFASGTLFFPESHTDLIFVVIGMDFGLIGAAFTILVSLFFNFTILNTAVLNRGHFNSHVCVGIFTSLMAQQFWNIGMTLGILPISGVTLPFISHGGSSILVSMMMLGIILSAHVEGKDLKHETATYQEDILYY